LKDFAVLAGAWHEYGPLNGDIDGDGTVGNYDLQWLMLHWTADCE
jgi:hypothetical protein